MRWAATCKGSAWPAIIAQYSTAFSRSITGSALEYSRFLTRQQLAVCEVWWSVMIWSALWRLLLLTIPCSDNGQLDYRDPGRNDKPKNPAEQLQELSKGYELAQKSFQPLLDPSKTAEDREKLMESDPAKTSAPRFRELAKANSKDAAAWLPWTGSSITWILATPLLWFSEVLGATGCLFVRLAAEYGLSHYRRVILPS